MSRQPHHCENVCRHHASRAGHETQSMSGTMGPVIGNLAGGQLSSGQGFESHPSHVLKAVNVLLQSHLVSQELTALTWWAYTFSSILDTHKFSCFWNLLLLSQGPSKILTFQLREKKIITAVNWMSIVLKNFYLYLYQLWKLLLFAFENKAYIVYQKYERTIRNLWAISNIKSIFVIYSCGD